MGAQVQNMRCAAVVVAVGLVGQGLTDGVGWASLVWLGGLVWLGFAVAYAWHDSATLRAHGRAVRAMERAERAQLRADARVARVALLRGAVVEVAGAGAGAEGAVRFVVEDDGAADTREDDER
ncbi:hypothetical protein [Microbacterium arborescens]|uniref:hypothetical protein n=1 Tax=Microbacterium arborescens TaxID=33883 RepID=UPI0013B3C32A|nr:hypothetical protein [Microbacterium arborescens]